MSNPSSSTSARATRSISTIRAGILEQGTVDLLTRIDTNTRVHTVGDRHDGIELRLRGEGHRVNYPGLVGRSVWLYP